MRSRITIVFLVVLFQHQPAKAQSNPFQNFIEEYLASFPNNAEIAIGIVDGDNIYKMGYRLIDGKVVAVKNDSTLFEIGSISKVFTAALLMKEVQKNTIALNDPVQKHLPFRIKNDTYQNQPLTVLHLVTHTSGLKKNPLVGYKRYSNYLKRFELDYLPGQKWEYNNLTVSMVGKFVGEKSSLSWSQSVKENLLKPLNMNDTYTNLDEVPKVNRVKCVDKKGERGGCYWHRIGEFHWPSGGMISNVNDMLKWLQANLTQENLSQDLHFIHDSHNPLADTISTAWFKKYNATQGISWFHYRTDANERIICHGGNMPGQTSFIAFDKVKRRGIVILTNLEGRTLMNDDQIMKTTDLSVRILGL